METRMIRRRNSLTKVMGMFVLAAGLTHAWGATAEGDQGQSATTSPVYWNWDPATVAGSSKLVRTAAGLSFTYHTSSLPVGRW